jgi:hypothetical protein
MLRPIFVIGLFALAGLFLLNLFFKLFGGLFVLAFMLLRFAITDHSHRESRNRPAPARAVQRADALSARATLPKRKTVTASAHGRTRVPRDLRS